MCTSLSSFTLLLFIFGASHKFYVQFGIDSHSRAQIESESWNKGNINPRGRAAIDDTQTLDSFIHIDAPPFSSSPLLLSSRDVRTKANKNFLFASIPLFHRSSCRFQSSSAGFLYLLLLRWKWKITSFSDLKVSRSFRAATHGHCCWQKKSTTGMSNGIRNVALFISPCAIHMGCWLCSALSSLSPMAKVQKCAKKDANEILKINRGWKARWKVKKHKSKFASPSSSSSTTHGREEQN